MSKKHKLLIRYAEELGLEFEFAPDAYFPFVFRWGKHEHRLRTYAEADTFIWGARFGRWAAFDRATQEFNKRFFAVVEHLEDEAK